MISTREFVLLVTKTLPETTLNAFEKIGKIANYASFISKEPTLDMFVGDNVLFTGWKLDDGIITIDDNPDNWLRVEENNVTGFDTLEELAWELKPYLELKFSKNGLKIIGIDENI